MYGRGGESKQSKARPYISNLKNHRWRPSVLAHPQTTAPPRRLDTVIVSIDAVVIDTCAAAMVGARGPAVDDDRRTRGRGLWGWWRRDETWGAGAEFCGCIADGAGREPLGSEGSCLKAINPSLRPAASRGGQPTSQAVNCERTTTTTRVGQGTPTPRSRFRECIQVSIASSRLILIKSVAHAKRPTNLYPCPSRTKHYTSPPPPTSNLQLHAPHSSSSTHAKPIPTLPRQRTLRRPTHIPDLVLTPPARRGSLTLHLRALLPRCRRRCPIDRSARAQKIPDEHETVVSTGSEHASPAGIPLDGVEVA